MLIIFSVNDQKITHDLKGQLVAGSVDIVQAAFKFDSSWDELDKIVVFTSSACPKPVPVQFADEAFYIPKDVLKPGKLYVSVVGFGLDGRKKTTQKWDIMQAITVQKCGDGGDCDLLRYLAQGQVADGKVAKDEEVKDMLLTRPASGLLWRRRRTTQRRTRPRTSVRSSPWLLMVRLPHTPSRTLTAISPLWALPQLILRPIPK